MSEAAITPLVMPKWGLEMREGTVTAWLVQEGDQIAVGTPLLEVETDKISNAVEAPDPGLLRRKVAKEGETLPVKALLGVLADRSVGDAEIDDYIANYVVPAAAEGDEDAQSAYATAEIDGITVRYARRGEGDGVPVLFLHGFGGDLGNWLFNLDALAEAVPVIALDLPGHGQSTPRLPGAKLGDLAEFVARFLDAIGVERVHVVGHSMGGAIAARLALDRPARVASVALVNSAGLGAEIAQPKFRSQFPGKRMAAGERPLRILPVGSTLDRQKGIFYWEPGPGFQGKYHLVFLEKRYTLHVLNVMKKVSLIFQKNKMILIQQELLM